MSILWWLVTLLAITTLVGIPFDVASFKLVNRTSSGRKVAILILAILYISLYFTGIALGFTVYEDALLLVIVIIPLPIISFILAVTAPKTTMPQAKETTDVSYLDQLERLKKLLDCGAITQEEYDKKKSEILDR